MEKKLQEPEKQSQTGYINLKNLPPLDPRTTSYSQQVRKIKTVARYVPKAVKPSPKEEGTKAGKLFDHEANTEADLLADRNLVYNKNNPRDDEDDACNCCIKHMIDSNNTISKTQTQSKVVSETSMDDKAFHNNSGKQKNASAKSQLHEICAANNWKPPLFECCKEEGPSHLRLFTFKVSMEIEGAAPSASILQCFGAPRPKKKAAAEHAAEGALWYLKHLGYFPIKKNVNK
ncbi:hypothetical protein P3X46_010797 [Hevea brasiliensis]|uniref:DRBM domain-containing protein n=1 Tax=Hevea brasiliensis TaxID=3981 RepID=A0ABQ9MIR6_HEVBR|nr:ribonuclease 3-like protein 1 [Hevea brasiliensis]KAJ9178956.1 hypothetical protein P3X46_010797 [Hevea brasiliensis]